MTTVIRLFSATSLKTDMLPLDVSPDLFYLPHCIRNLLKEGKSQQDLVLGNPVQSFT